MIAYWSINIHIYIDLGWQIKMLDKAPAYRQNLNYSELKQSHNILDKAPKISTHVATAINIRFQPPLI